MMTSQVSLSGKFYSVVARGEMPHATVLSELQQINQQDWCPSPYNKKDAFIKACLAHRELIAQRLSVVLSKRINHLQIEFKEHRDSNVNGWEWVYVDKAASKNDYTFIASAKLQEQFDNIAIYNDTNSCVTPGILNAAYSKNLVTICGGSVGKLLRRLGECLEKLGCGQYLSSGFFWISDKAPDHVHDNNHYYDAWFDVIKVLRKVASDTGSSLRVRCLDVTPDEDSYGMVTDAIRESIAKKVSKLQSIFDLDKTQPDDHKLTDRELNTKAKEVAVITKQIQELDSRLSLGSLVTDLQSALNNAQQDCAMLQSQAKARNHNSNRSMMRRRLTVSRPMMTTSVSENS